MKPRANFYILPFVAVFTWCNYALPTCKATESSIEPTALQSVLQKGYASAKSVFDDVKVEYQEEQVRLLEPAMFNKVFGVEVHGPASSIQVQEYIRKHGKERWALLHVGTSSPADDVSHRSDLIRTKDSPRFKVFDGHALLDYIPLADGYTSVGRATLDVDTRGLFQSTGPRQYAPVAFLGFDARLLPDDVLSSPQLRIETTPETIDGLVAYKIHASFVLGKVTTEVTYWLCPARSCLPVKTEVVWDGMVRRRMEVKEFLEIGDGRWVIKSVTQRNFGSEPGEDVPLALADITYTLRRVEVNPELDEETVFCTSPDRLPGGVEVIDRISGLRYFVGEGPVS